MPLIDTHAHVYLDEFDTDRAQVIVDAGKAGIQRILMPAVDSTTHDSMFAAESAFPGVCQSMMGVHPCSIKENYRQELVLAREWLIKRTFIGIGETGLDFYWDLSYTDQQYEAFNTQAEWAIEFDLPLVIHSRNSIDQCIEVIANYKQRGLRGVFHCFSGNSLQAEKIIDLGFYLGIGGVLTFKNSGLDKVMRELGLEKVVLETDAPYLAPVPHRGKRNECSYMALVAEKLATLKNVDVAEVHAITTANAIRLFGDQRT